MLIKVPGTQTYVNPAYVTNVYATKPIIGSGELCISALEVEGHAGYRTKEVRSTATVDQLAALLNKGN